MVRTHRQPGPQPISVARQELRQVYLAYVAALLTDIDHYLERDDIDPGGDGATLRLAAMWFTNDELHELAAGFGKLLQPYLDRPAPPDRTRKVLRTIVLPSAESHEQKAT
jgi:hypothetical protein